MRVPAPRVSPQPAGSRSTMQRASRLPFKMNADRWHRIPKRRYRVTNWADHDAALRQRGSLAMWFSKDAVAAWQAEPRTTRGGQPWYSALAITKPPRHGQSPHPAGKIRRKTNTSSGSLSPCHLSRRLPRSIAAVPASSLEPMAASGETKPGPAEPREAGCQGQPRFRPYHRRKPGHHQHRPSRKPARLPSCLHGQRQRRL